MKSKKIKKLDWKRGNLGDICVLEYGKNLPEKKREVGEIPVYGSNGVVGYHNKPLINSRGIIIGRKGSAGLVHYSSVPFYPIDTTFFISPDKSNVDFSFLYYLLLSLNLKRLKSDVGVPGLNREMAYKEIVCLPKDEIVQKSIARTLSTVQEVIAGQEELIVKLKELKRNMMHYLFTHGTRGEKTKMTEIGEIPESWEVVELNILGDVVTGSTPSTKEAKYYLPSEVNFITPGDINNDRYVYTTERYVSNLGAEAGRIIPKSSICCVCIGSSIGKVAKSWMRSITNQQINSIICNINFDSDFVYYLMSFYSDYWRSHATFGPVPLLSKGNFSIIKLPICRNKKEQEEIGLSLTTIDNKIEVIQNRLSVYQNLFKTLLHELMSGE